MVEDEYSMVKEGVCDEVKGDCMEEERCCVVEG